MRGRLGEGCGGEQQLRILNRIITLSEDGLIYEADPRHIDILMNSLNLAESNAVTSLGVKPSDRDEMANKLNEDDITNLHI